MSQREYLRQLPSHQRGPTSHDIAYRLHLDGPLLGGLFAIMCYSLFILYSAGGEDTDLLIRQLSRYLAGFVALFVLAQFPPRTFRFWTPVLYGIGLIMLVLVLVMGVEAKGAQRWLSVPGLGRFQPSELMKVAVPALVAWFFRDRALPPSLRDIALALAIIIIPVLLIAKQPDLGTSLLIIMSGITVLFMAGLSWRIIGVTALGAAVAAPLMYFHVLHDYQRRRVDTFLNPEADPLGAGWNIIQSKTAIGSGGLQGKGWLQGTQSRLDFLPESHTDFIFAVIAEELGLFGILLLFALYLFVIGRGLWISYHAQDLFSRLFGAGITLTFFIYILVNVGMVSGLLPVVGVPLPLISYGGTSIVTLLAGFGILMSIHTHRRLMG
ncbi:MAG: rod shape-determining protein RodA [Alcanivoracaceae bacterium]